jgi:hypothetical protein
LLKADKAPSGGGLTSQARRAEPKRAEILDLETMLGYSFPMLTNLVGKMNRLDGLLS